MHIRSHHWLPLTDADPSSYARMLQKAECLKVVRPVRTHSASQITYNVSAYGSFHLGNMFLANSSTESSQREIG